MYVTQHLVTLGHQVKGHLTEIVKPGGATFVDLIPTIRRLGTAAFLQQMTAQRDIILNYLKEAQGRANERERRGGHKKKDGRGSKTTQNEHQKF